MKERILILSISAILFFSCNSAPKPIVYGSDGCHFCSMTIVDQQHAAQYMTKKGRSYAFDATECMLNKLKEIDSEKISLYLVNDSAHINQILNISYAVALINSGVGVLSLIFQKKVYISNILGAFFKIIMSVINIVNRRDKQERTDY